jgi:hypothetical protein
VLLTMPDNDLREIHLFQGLSESELRRGRVCARERIFAAGEFVYYKADNGADFYVIAGAWSS